MTAGPGDESARRRTAGDPAAGPAYRPLTRLEIARAVPEGSRRARSQGDALRALDAVTELAEMRADRQRNLLEIWRFLVRAASWADRTTMPVRGRLCAELSVSVSTWKRARRWLEDHGVLGTVRHGFTPMLKPMAIADEAVNEAAVYVLCVPRKTSRPPAAERPAAKNDPLTRSPEVTGPSHAPASTPEEGRRQKPAAHFRRHVAAVRQGPVRKLSERWVAWAARPFLAAGWSPADLAFAIAHHPVDGRHKGSVSDVTNPGAWLGWRLSRWLADPAAAWAHWREAGCWPAGTVPAESPSMRTWRDVKPVGDVYLERSRAKAAAAAAAAAGPSSWPDRIRQQLGWRKA